MENTSGMKDGAVPAELKGLNWGAFFLNIIWAIAHGAWLWAVLCLVPCVNVIATIYLLLKGNEIAWRSKRWESVDAFKATQRKWATAGLIVVVIGIVVGIISSIVGGVASQQEGMLLLHSLI